MNLQFNDMRELTEFLTWADAFSLQGAINPLPLETTPGSAEQQFELRNEDETPDAGPGEQGDGVRQASGEVGTASEAPVEQKRKRRTKAEMEAARAAEQAGAPAVTEAGKTETTPAGTSAVIAPENSGNPFAQAELPAEQPKIDGSELTKAKSSDTGDLKEFLAARIAERPELSQVEHLQIARTFIGKHGIARYNESFALVGLSANVMTFSTADCALHAAVLDYLGSE